jgi:hypothetical protein
MGRIREDDTEAAGCGLPIIGLILLWIAIVLLLGLAIRVTKWAF